jgi:hypothetical protein
MDATTAQDEVLRMLETELRRRRDWLLHEQDAVRLIRRHAGGDAVTAHALLDDLVADHRLVRHRPRRRDDLRRGWPPRCAQDAFSVATSA